MGCSLACTDGMVRALERLGDRPIHAGCGSQSARPDGEQWTLHARKWFCSNVNADCFLVTTPDRRRAGCARVAVFLVPAYAEDVRLLRNGYTIDRLNGSDWPSP